MPMRAVLRTLAISILAALSLARTRSLEAAAPQAEDARADAAELLIDRPQIPAMDQAEAAGLPRGSRPEVLTWERVYRLALARSRSARGSSFSESLDPEALEDQTRRLGLADFTRFREDFLGHRQEADRSARAFRDPSAMFFDVLRRLQSVETAWRTVGLHERFLMVMRDLVANAASGVTQFDVDACDLGLQQARAHLSEERSDYRDHLEQLKVELGLMPGAQVIPDRKSLAVFSNTFEAARQWFNNPRRTLDELPQLARRLPDVEDVVLEFIAGRRVLGSFANSDELESLLTAAERSALRGRDPKDSHVDLRLRIRRRIRTLIDTWVTYEIQRRALVLALRMEDQAFSRLRAPVPNAGPASSPVKDLLESDRQVAEVEHRLVALWISCQTDRLALYRDLGTFPYNDWPGFYAQFQAARGDGGHDTRPIQNLRPAAAAPAPDAPAPPPPAPAPASAPRPAAKK